MATSKLALQKQYLTILALAPKASVLGQIITESEARLTNPRTDEDSDRMYALMLGIEVALSANTPLGKTDTAELMSFYPKLMETLQINDMITALHKGDE